MSYNPDYDPDDNAKPVGRLFTRQLSQRDLSLSIPVNFVENAGISLTAACFSHNRYVGDEAQRCFSNLLAIGFHRYEIDVYWDVSRQLWSLCPVEMGGESSPEDPQPTRQTIPANQETDLSMVAMSSPVAPVPRRADVGDLQRRQAASTDPTLNAIGISPGSATSTAADVAATSISASASTFTATDAASQSSSSDAGDDEQTGAYVCSQFVDLDWLSRIMWTYLDTTETNLNATLRYMILHLHAAAPASDLGGEVDEPSFDDLPGSGDSLGSLLSSNLSSFLYTPQDLRQERANLNNDWFDVPNGMGPTTAYYDVQEAGDISSTMNGWPSENYVEMQEGKRLFIGFGSIDPQMEGYDISRDDNTIFPQDYLENNVQISIDAAGQVTSGCFYTPNDYAVTSINNSWALSTSTSVDESEIPLSSNITRCGISPILNSTLSNVTADQDFRPYQTYLHSTLWSWAPDYPRAVNSSSASAMQLTDPDDSLNTNNDPGSQNRCAVLNATSGSWQNVVCDTVHYSACRRKGSIYDWSVSSDDTTYTKAGVSCRDGSDFDVPRTGLQNAYLVNTWRAHLSDPATASDPMDPLLWLNFNNLDSELCWVIGQNTTCPYVNRRSGTRQVVVPVVAAVIVFALGVFTVFVKCAANRQMNKRQRRRRKRGDDGWDYEGVPS